MWVTKLLISPVKKGLFAQKRPNLARNWHFCPFGSFGALLLGWLVVVARAVSLVNDLVVNHIMKERLGQQCVRIQVKHIFYDFSKVVLPSPGPGEK